MMEFFFGYPSTPVYTPAMSTGDCKRSEIEQTIWKCKPGKLRIRWIKKWIETLTCDDHHDCFSEPMFRNLHDTRQVCDLCWLPCTKLYENCYSCDRRLGKECGCAGGEPEMKRRITCEVCSFKENFFILCSCGIDECYNYWGINPKLETYFLCRRHKNPLANRCVPQEKCSTCRNKVIFPYCSECPFSIPKIVRCKTCVKWSLG